MTLACYDPGARHLGECILDPTGDRPRCLLARPIELREGLPDDELALLARVLRTTWEQHGVRRVVLERSRGIGGADDVAMLRKMSAHMIGTAEVASLIRGVALAMGMEVASYSPRAIRAGLKIKATEATSDALGQSIKAAVRAYVREHVDGWEQDNSDAPEGAAGSWYRHASDAGAVGLWDIEARRQAEERAARKAERDAAPKRDPREPRVRTRAPREPRPRAVPCCIKCGGPRKGHVRGLPCPPPQPS